MAEASDPSPRLLIVTGLSGAGKSTVSRALEDIGYFCVDNLPVGLVPNLMESLAGRGRPRPTAVCIDIREREYLHDFPSLIDDLKGRGMNVRVLFLDCEDEILLRRFTETRRRHPVNDAPTLADGLRIEREEMASIRAKADRILDTSNLTVHDLRRKIQNEWLSDPQAGAMKVQVLSFGFKHGLPETMDLLYDVRFLPNPYFHDELKDRGGDDPAVIDFVMRHEETHRFLDLLENDMRFLLPQYRAEGKSYLTLAIGCTGGRHRSVVVAESLVKRLSDMELAMRFDHRDLDRK